MTLHEKHMELVDACNSASSQREYDRLNSELNGFRMCADFLRPHNTLRTWADLTVMDRGEKRPLCCGVLFWDYSNDRMAEKEAATGAKEEGV